ncbi:MAG: hypothetical protein HY874_03995 [Chloroflexi bacterium]|nr:hypothetical protein [Chloroflexota bacterium]
MRGQAHRPRRVQWRENMVRVVRAAGLVVAVVVIAALAAACGDGGGEIDGVGVKLAGSPIPTVSPVPPTPVICAPATPMSLPESFPKEIPVPEDYVVWAVETVPYLHVVGRTTPPFDQGNPPHGIVADALNQKMGARGWRGKLNQGVDGGDYDLTAPDGRVMHFNALPKPECGDVQLTYDLRWVTP